MAKQVNNVFKIARQEASLKQEDAIQQLGIKDSTTLSRYENDVTIPPDEIVAKMIQVYNAPWLGYMYLQQYTNVGKKILPQLVLGDFGLTVLKFQKEFSDINLVKSEMIDIACDGEVGVDEKQRWNVAMKEVKELIGAGISLLLKKEKPSQGCNLERAL